MISTAAVAAAFKDGSGGAEVEAVAEDQGGLEKSERGGSRESDGGGGRTGREVGRDIAGGGRKKEGL